MKYRKLFSKVFYFEETPIMSTTVIVQNDYLMLCFKKYKYYKIVFFCHHHKVIYIYCYILCIANVEFKVKR